MNDLEKKTLPVKWFAPTKSGKSLMDVLLEKLIVMYPSASQNFFITPERIQVWSKDWAESFDRNGIVPEDIRRGLIECEKAGDQFMPSLPLFLAYCKPPVIPIMHQSFPKLEEQKMTNEERIEGLKHFSEFKNKLFGNNEKKV